jgi:hypothetical protein
MCGEGNRGIGTKYGKYNLHYEPIIRSRIPRGSRYS